MDKFYIAIFCSRDWYVCYEGNIIVKAKDLTDAHDKVIKLWEDAGNCLDKNADTRKNSHGTILWDLIEIKEK